MAEGEEGEEGAAGLASLPSHSSGFGSRVIVVEVHGARRLISKDAIANPFCTVQLDEQVKQTEVQPRTKEPVWDETFCFQMPYMDTPPKGATPSSATQTLELCIYDTPTAAHSSAGIGSAGSMDSGRSSAAEPEPPSLSADGKRVLLGRVRVPISVCGDTPGVPLHGLHELKWYPLERRTVLSKVKGELGLRLSYLEGESSQRFLSSQESLDRSSSTPSTPMTPPGSSTPTATASPSILSREPSRDLAPADAPAQAPAEARRSSRELSVPDAAQPLLAKAPSAPSYPAFPSSPSSALPGAQNRVSITKSLTSRLFSSSSSAASASASVRGSLSGPRNYSFHVEEYLFFKLIQARSLAAVDRGGTSDPYVTFSFRGNQVRSRTIPKELNPQWNEVYAFLHDKEEGVEGEEDPFPDSLHITVWDENKLTKSQFLGQISVPLKPIVQREPGSPLPQPAWFPLDSKPGIRYAIKGDLQVCFWLGTKKDDHFADAWQSEVGGVARFRARQYTSPELWYLRVRLVDLDNATVERRPNAELVVRMKLGSQKRQSKAATRRERTHSWGEADRDLFLVAGRPFSGTLELDVVDASSSDELLWSSRLPLSSVPHRLSHLHPVPVRSISLDRSRSFLQSKDLQPAPSFSAATKSTTLHVGLALEGGYHVVDESPAHLSSELPSAPELAPPDAVGHLEMTVVGATGLERPDGKKGGVSAYAVAKYSRTWFRTRTVSDDNNPLWREQCSWPVFDPCTVLTIGVFDSRHLKASTKDAALGKIRIRLNTLESGRVYHNHLPLLVLAKTSVAKVGKLELILRFSCFATADVVKQYIRPPLPLLHYLEPIPDEAQNSLKKAAVDAVTEHLGSFEPPLSPEVVAFMTDSDDNVFSLRRLKANFQRVKAVVMWVKGTFEIVGKVRGWENVPLSLICYALYAFFIFRPHLILPALFLLIALRGLAFFTVRPQAPPFMDLKLSQGEEASYPNEEEEEEVDDGSVTKETLSANPVKLYKALKAKYEKLIAVAFVIQKVLDGIAKAGEKAGAILSWRDPRASAIATCAAFILALIFYAVPIQPLAVVVGWWVFRPPSMWPITPTKLTCFFGRLPTLADSIY